DDRTITRNEVAAILAKHVVYENSENPTSERERVYRWLKRQFIHLTTATVSPTTALEITGDVEKQRCVAEAVAAVDPATATAPLLAAGRYQDSSFMSWDSA
ncbi:unnamed protein product, partial [Pylaiella littoralis]